MVSSSKVASSLRRVLLGARVKVKSCKGKPITVDYEWFEDAKDHALYNDWRIMQHGPQPRVTFKRMTQNYPATHRRYEVLHQMLVFEVEVVYSERLLMCDRRVLRKSQSKVK